MNFRIDLPNEEVRSLINQDDISRLVAADQLKKCKDTNVILKRYNEGEIKFKPTYKFDNNCDVYDTSKKKRIPSYTDRVLFCRDP